MRHILLGCLLTLFSTVLFATPKTDLALLNLKGPIKKWERKLIERDRSRVYEHEITYFNLQGFKTKQEILGRIYPPFGKVAHRFVKARPKSTALSSGNLCLRARSKLHNNLMR